MRLSSEDARWLRAETPVAPSTFAVGLQIEATAPPVTVDDVRAQIEQQIDAVPWVSWRLHAPKLGRPRWIDRGPVDLDDMIVRDEAVDGLDKYLAELSVTPVDWSFPPWQLRLVDVPDGSQAIVVHMHHVFGDGYVLAAMVNTLFGVVAPSRATGPKAPTRLSVMTLAGDAIWGIASFGYRTASKMRSSAQWEPARVGEPLVGALSSARSVASRAFPLSRLEAVAHAYGASVTRLMLGLIARALDPLVDEGPALELGVRALFPHGTQQGPVVRPGNAGRATYLDLPLHVEPVERLARLSTAIAVGASAPVYPVVADVTLSFPSAFDPLHVAGRPIVSSVVAGPLRVCSRPYTRLTVMVHECGGTRSVTYIGDRPSLGDEVARLVQRTAAALEEFEATAPELHAPVVL